jgi:hypothetical protein
MVPEPPTHWPNLSQTRGIKARGQPSYSRLGKQSGTDGRSPEAVPANLPTGSKIAANGAATPGGC